ncbi:unnamed protein product [Lota lota]
MSPAFTGVGPFHSRGSLYIHGCNPILSLLLFTSALAFLLSAGPQTPPRPEKSVYDHLSTIVDYSIEMIDVLDEINYQSYNGFVPDVGAYMEWRAILTPIEEEEDEEGDEEVEETKMGVSAGMEDSEGSDGDGEETQNGCVKETVDQIGEEEDEGDKDQEEDESSQGGGEEDEEDSDMPLRVLRPRRLSRGFDVVFQETRYMENDLSESGRQLEQWTPKQEVLLLGMECEAPFTSSADKEKKDAKEKSSTGCRQQKCQ